MILKKFSVVVVRTQTEDVVVYGYSNLVKEICEGRKVVFMRTSNSKEALEDIIGMMPLKLMMAFNEGQRVACNSNLKVVF